ncbi:MAG: XTP/dITP diphosphatase [Eubacteriales bacterium]|jgi:XTP/dITP diphosphohydrolase|nr:XTP/dITP diphosphatase [Bacillota bacterium]MBV1727122.1 XTP/dITP diphosphatase [Desulforudis sp.]MDP3051253.1 XTP/dITP diphosphatase [Eubacteriales bacterium]MBU4554172.1 XTP/dITP diphosphatase [Bacillota bacterium]MBV1735670.1 XTP/dITP diphosphatase [Desulforudis sp.]
MKRLLLATRNKGKVREIHALLADLGVKVLSLSDYPDIPDIPEDGTTFAENAVFKAQEVARLTGEITLADDSGLEVDALNGEPGVHSARFAGEPKNDEANNTKLIALLEDVPPVYRTARFRCVIALVTPDGDVHTAEGACEGLIILKPRGDNGFGYDPLFFVPEYDQTFAELPLDIKNQISHRGRALAKVKDLVRQVLT